MSCVFDVDDRHSLIRTASYGAYWRAVTLLTPKLFIVMECGALKSPRALWRSRKVCDSLKSRPAASPASGKRWSQGDDCCAQKAGWMALLCDKKDTRQLAPHDLPPEILSARTTVFHSCLKAPPKWRGPACGALNRLLFNPGQYAKSERVLHSEGGGQADH